VITYRTTNKHFERLLSREQRQIYLLVFNGKSSQQELALQSGLPDEQVGAILHHLRQEELIAPEFDGQPKLEVNLESVKQNLVFLLRFNLGAKAEKYILEVEAQTSQSALFELMHKVILRLRLTTSKEAANRLESAVNLIFT
jgi:DNA-binding IclR family transcriptional regulator